MKRIARCFAVGSIALVLFSAPCTAASSGSDAVPDGVSAATVTMEQIKQGWEIQERAFRSARFVWHGRRWEKKGWYMNPQQSKSFNPRGITDPPTDLEYEVSASLVLDGKRRAYTYRNSNWDYGDDYVGPKDAVELFDGKVCRAFSPPGCVLPFPDGVISHSWKGEQDMWLFPLLLGIGASQSIKEGADDYGVSPEQGIIEGTPCVIIQLRHGERVTESLWLDPKRQFVVRRACLFSDEGELRQQTDIWYQDDESQRVAAPSRWRVAAIKAQASYMLGEAEVEEYVIDPELSDDVFQFEFPVGTRVLDATKKKRTEYIIKKGGEHRPVLAREWEDENRDPKDASTWRPTYERIRDTPPPADALPRGLSGLRLWLIGLSVAALVLVSAFFLRRRHKLRKEQ